MTFADLQEPVVELIVEKLLVNKEEPFLTVLFQKNTIPL